jgi:hypothetical protein
MVQKSSLNRKIVVGLDFDGVVAYSPIRIARAPIKWFKREILGIKGLTFYLPKSLIEKMLWRLVFETSMLPAKGVEELKILANNPRYEFHLITGRFDFMKPDLYNWLEKNGLRNLFKTINVNVDNAQPHIFKERMIEKLAINYYVEDNLDVVLHLTSRVKAKIVWIYNFMDIRHPYPDKQPYLKAALDKISG